MSEKQIRDILRDVCSDLDRHSRRVVRQGVRKIVLPTVLGAGLALSGCSDDAIKKDTSPLSEAGVEAGAEAGPADLAYMGPDAGPPDGPAKKDDGKVVKDGVGTPDMVYMGPDAAKTDGGPMPPYMAPEGGMLYMAPDGGAVPPYMAPDAKTQPPDGGPMPPYMAPPDKGTP